MGKQDKTIDRKYYLNMLKERKANGKATQSELSWLKDHSASTGYKKMRAFKNRDAKFR